MTYGADRWEPVLNRPLRSIEIEEDWMAPRAGSTIHAWSRVHDRA